MTRIDRGRRYYSDKPTGSVTVNMNFEGSVPPSMELLRVLRRELVRYRDIGGRDDGEPIAGVLA